MTVKMAVTCIALHSSQKETRIPLLNSLNNQNSLQVEWWAKFWQEPVKFFLDMLNHDHWLRMHNSRYLLQSSVRHTFVKTEDYEYQRGLRELLRYHKIYVF